MCTIVIADETGPRLDRLPCRRSRNGCPSEGLACRLRRAGLRPTRQRLELGRLLFGKGHRHVTAEALHEEVEQAGLEVSLATVYNTLNQFTKGGLLRQVTIDGPRTFFDTNMTNHHHYFVEGESEPWDIDPAAVGLLALPQPPEGLEVVRVDVVIRLRPNRPD